MKRDIRNANDWTGEKANLAVKVMELCKDFMFPCYKFLKDGRKSYKPENNKRFCYFLGKNMANTYKNTRIATTGLRFEDEWDKLRSNDWFEIQTYEVQLGKRHLSAVFW
jgi:hypothetical protein